MDTSKNDRFSTVTIMRIFCSVLEAIVYLHSQSPPIIHRDIKVLHTADPWLSVCRTANRHRCLPKCALPL